MPDEGVIERFAISTHAGNVQVETEVSVVVAVDTAAVSPAFTDWEAVDLDWQGSVGKDVVVVVGAGDTERVDELSTRVRSIDVKLTESRRIPDERLG